MGGSQFRFSQRAHCFPSPTMDAAASEGMERPIDEAKLCNLLKELEPQSNVDLFDILEEHGFLTADEIKYRPALASQYVSWLAVLHTDLRCVDRRLRQDIGRHRKAARYLRAKELATVLDLCKEAELLIRTADDDDECSRQRRSAFVTNVGKLCGNLGPDFLQQFCGW